MHPQHIHNENAMAALPLQGEGNRLLTTGSK